MQKKWAVHVWFDPAPPGQYRPKEGQCAWEGETGGFGQYEADPYDGITFELSAEFSSNPIRSITFREGKPEVDIDRRKLDTDRNMMHMYAWILDQPSTAFVWVKSNNRGSGGDYGKIYEVYNVNREHGWKFPDER